MRNPLPQAVFGGLRASPEGWLTVNVPEGTKPTGRTCAHLACSLLVEVPSERGGVSR